MTQPDAQTVLGIDLGGTKVAFALGDAAGGVRATFQRPTDPSGDPRADVERMVADLALLTEQARTPLDEVAMVGVSVPGPFDPASGRVLRPPNLPGWDDVPVRGWLGEALGRPVFLENDANAAALAEWHFGAGQGARHLVYLTMSTGVGGGLILDGRLYRGVRGGAGEIGHLVLVPDGEPCGCGMRGCAEAYLGGGAWTARLRRETPASSRAAELAGGAPRVTPREVVAAAREGDAFARAEMARWNEHLARLVAAVSFVLAPEVVVLGTIAVAAGEELCLGPVRARVAELSWPAITRDLRILPAALGDQLAAHAALAVAIEGLEARP